ncbi:2-oxo acid dehydrogenase subunit E2 [Altererythrobacter xixiisoli]|uniref:Dihydrolipoamide acetyltransferase component of pyruvate dehydrogenase complex n=1 Tax=Croceibacterium xixiisoli TaxID=1476466 RepID=A0A6I4TVF5_9SPHN|nr:dihydrolipoamide acetyltransferase family protein [Croceibacterium xixiisoli]MXO99792.1 2-oxo acid dehydrogenase subunit E2 [Croceibacterium xixiisoli]
MARFTFNLPDVGEGIAQAEIVAWHVKLGDHVAEDGRIADLMTDKATVEMESPVAGKVIEIAGEVGDVIAIGTPLVVLETEATQAPEPQGSESLSAVAAADAGGMPEAPPAAVPQTSPALDDSKVEASHDRRVADQRVLASPAVRQRSRDLGIDLADVRPAADGRVRHADLDAFITYNARQGYAVSGAVRADETVKVVGLRRRIAENMAAAKRHIPHFTYVEECDVTELEKVRAELNATRESGGAQRPRLTMLPLLIAAICRELANFPMLNAHYDDQANVITRLGAVHLGVATMTDAGLMVPVIRDAQAKNLWQLAAQIARLAEAARNGTAQSSELSGSSFTLSSLGPLGGIASTPIVNRPEVAILAPNRIVERPMFVRDDSGGERIARRKLMNISISCDHRVVDGYDAAAFAQAVKRLIETPSLLLVG